MTRHPLARLMFERLWFAAATFLFALLAAATAQLFLRPAHATDADRPVIVFAAASTKTALDATLAQWSQATGQKAVASYASSGALAKQIENGAPADIFLSANVVWMDHLAGHNLVRSGTRRDLLGNDLVLIAPAASDVAITIEPGFPLAEILGTGRLVMGTPPSVPAGVYAKEALVSLGIWDAVAAKVAGVDNVRTGVALVARGEAPLAIVYRTDATGTTGVRIVAAFPATSHAPIVYPVAMTTASDHPEAEALLTFLGSPEAKAHFETAGFRTAVPSCKEASPPC